MRVLSKRGDDLLLIAEGNEVSKGDYVKVVDATAGLSLLAQVYEVEYFDVPGIEEDLLRDLLLEGLPSTSDPEYGSITKRVKDAKLIRCKVRGTLSPSGLSPSADWLPSRTSSKIERVPGAELASLISAHGDLAMRIGRTLDGDQLQLSLSALDGSLTLVLGKKGSGKSHLSKLLVNGLVRNGAYVVVFDINNEYEGLSTDRTGAPSPLSRKVLAMEPGVNLRFNMRYLGKGVMSNVLRNALGLPSVSLREFLRIWNYLEDSGRLSFASLGEYIEKWRMNDMVRDALLSRYYALASTKIVSDDGSFRIEDMTAGDGGALVLMLAGISPVARKVVVEVLLSKLLDLLHSRAIPPMFILAEEAHMYVRETYWEDLVTRMRHYGAFAIFVTNQPDALKDYVYRQADNLFLFNYTNSKDVELIARFSATDSDTLMGILPTLRQGRCLLVGKATGWLPLVMDVDEAPFQSLGQTRLFFDGMRITQK